MLQTFHLISLKITQYHQAIQPEILTPRHPALSPYYFNIMIMIDPDRTKTPASGPHPRVTKPKNHAPATTKTLTNTYTRPINFHQCGPGLKFSSAAPIIHLLIIQNAHFFHFSRPARAFPRPSFLSPSLRLRPLETP